MGDNLSRVKKVIEAVSIGNNDFDPEVSLLEAGMIDSLTILEIVNGLEEEFDIEFDDDELEIENFESVARIHKLINAKVGDE